MIQLGIAVPAEMLKSGIKQSTFITLIISGGTHGIRWVFDDAYIWTHFVSNISIDLMKAALAALAGVAAMYIAGKRATQVIVVKLWGVFVGFSAGYGASLISNESIQDATTQMAQDIAQTYVQVYGAISNPSGVIIETGDRAKDVLICSADVAFERVETIIRDNINRAVRPFINPIQRFY